MDMSKFRPESHVAQQSRRDKLRVQQSSNLPQHLEEFPNNLEQGSSVHHGLNPDLVQVRNVRNANLLYDSTLISSGMIHFSTNSNVLPSSQRDSMLHQELGTAQENRQMPAELSSFTGMTHSILSKFNASSKVSDDPQGSGNWKSVDSQHSCDWMVGYASGLAGSRESNHQPMFVGEVLSNKERESNITAATRCLKSNYSAYQDVQSSTLPNPGSEISSQDNSRHYGDLRFVSPSLYQNDIQDGVTTASVGTQGLEIASLVQQNVREAARGSWVDYYGNQSSSMHYDNAGAWMNRPVVEHSQQWGGEMGFLASKSSEQHRAASANDATTQGLSLSLSSNPTPKICNAAQLIEYGPDHGFHSKPGESRESPRQDSKPSKPYLCSMEKPLVTSKGGGGKSHLDTAGTSTYLHRHTGPLGPFTGYATILKNSRFLKPAQDLLDEICHMTNSKPVKACDASEGISGEVSASASADATNVVDMEAGASNKGNNAGASSTFFSSNEIRVDGGAVGSSSDEPCRPEYQQKKAKLLYLQEEVCRRYKVYHQQMQMVVSSFESVAGLSAASPYISLALKTVTRNFRCLRNAISDQIRHLSRALGEELLSPSTGTSGSKGDKNMSRLKYVGQKSGGVNMGFLEPQQHGWRPQRGLPERSVAILRAWLFDHFLHPYPTDTDKHMLATKTGLSRNQVSNWFINARVRVWKPMVEEIHMLESKGLTEGNQNLSRSEVNSTSEGGACSLPNEDQPISRSSINMLPDKQLACPDFHATAMTGLSHDAQNWNHEKCSRMEFHIPTSIEGSLMGFVPYQQSRLDMGGLGAVSLTLGLRHGVETAQQQQQQYERQEGQLRRQFGGQMIHDFAG